MRTCSYCIHIWGEGGRVPHLYDNLESFELILWQEDTGDIYYVASG